MEKFELTILGCGSASPTLQHNPSSQVLNVRDKLFMIDCGEGTQKEFRKHKFGFNRLTRIFISHLHGDHCFGLMGLISTLGLLGRTGDLYIHAPKSLENLLRPQLDYFCRESPFKVIIEEFSTTESRLIYDDRSVSVHTIPLTHRVPCAGFLFREKPKDAQLIGEMLEYHQVPISERNKIKQGADFVKEDGTVIPNKVLTRPAATPRSYAYCSDTAYNERIIPLIENIDLLYHESTFADADADRAPNTGHSTAKQAATIASKANVKKLMLGHFSSRYPNNRILLDEAKSVFANTILANEGICEKL